MVSYKLQLNILLELGKLKFQTQYKALWLRSLAEKRRGSCARRKSREAVVTVGEHAATTPVSL
jgi:hypothetical protein